jgi:hypothetical protein
VSDTKKETVKHVDHSSAEMAVEDYTYTRWWLEGAVLDTAEWAAVPSAAVASALPPASPTSMAVSAAAPLFPLEEAPALPLLLWGTVRRDRRSSFTAIASQISGLKKEKLFSYS